MPRYEISINEEINNTLVQLAEAAHCEVVDLLHDFLDESLVEGIAKLAIIQYKKGHMKAIDAWKMSGLSYQEFQTQALLSSLP
ncbi:MAG: hypothetical protein HeimC2_06530 [Candidatus Heimdallarchaeota archaeon LC_2]|nr:MAG: hypothetical protein HeimC2_06530 [Candidatus Heimdallarchaeota archaeon LC_2]